MKQEGFVLGMVPVIQQMFASVILDLKVHNAPLKPLLQFPHALEFLEMKQQGFALAEEIVPALIFANASQVGMD